MVQQNGEYVIYGITSFGAYNCGAKGKPGVYTQVSKYISWINEKMREPCVGEYISTQLGTKGRRN